jgi:hypothetical protein
MIERGDVIPLVLEVCPSFREFCDDEPRENLLYLVMGDLALHLRNLVERDETEEIAPVCRLIERLHLEGDGYVRALATCGLLEDLRSVWTDRGADPNEFHAWLHPTSRGRWRELEAYWAGDIPAVGAAAR